MKRGQKEMEYDVVKYNPNGFVQQNGRQHSYEQVQPYYSQLSIRQQPIQVQLEAEKQAHRNNFKAQQNAAAIASYSKLDRGKVHEGKHAFAVTQMHQNDLHNLDVVPLHPTGKQNGVVVPGDRSLNYIKQHLHLQTKFAHAQSSGSHEQSTAKSGHNSNNNSDLTTSFDPMKDRHLWTMWRTAVNGRIVDEVRQLEQKKIELGPMAVPHYESVLPGMYGKALVVTPLKRFIRVDQDSKAIADQMSNCGQGILATSQFVYYGLPRVYVSHRK
jgi:hypothetical protein